MSGPEGEKKVKLFVQLSAERELIIVVPLTEKKNFSSVCLHVATSYNDPKVDILGAPMIPDVQYYLLPGKTVCIYSWSSSTIEISGSSTLIRSVQRNPCKSIVRPLVEYHCMLHQSRAEADKKGGVGPITLICGSPMGLKAQIGRSLCSYAARSGWKPILVDLDCSVSQSIGVPGSIGAAIVEYPITVDEVISQTLISILYYIGSLECQKNTDLGMIMSPTYLNYTTVLLDTVQKRFLSHLGTLSSSSGAVVIVPEVAGFSGANFLMNIAEKYMISNILVCGDDYLFYKLYSRFCDNLPVVQTKVEKISQGYFSSIKFSQETLLSTLYKEFFYGNGATNLYPASWTQPLDMIEIYCLKDENKSAVLVAVEMEALQGIVGCIAGLYYLNNPQSLLMSSPFTLAKIESIDSAGLHLLTTTHSPPLERLCAVVGSIRWISS